MRTVFAAALLLCVAAVASAPAQAAGERFPGMTAELWRADLETFVQQAPQRHGNLYRFLTPQAFADAVHALEARLPQLSDDEVVAGLERIVATIGDGHDGVLAACGAGDATNFPLRLRSFPDGVLVTAAPPALNAVLGANLVAIDGKPIEEVWRVVADAIPHDHDNEESKRSRAPSFLTCSGMLHGLGITAHAGQASYTFERAGRRTTLTLQPQVPVRAIFVTPPDWAHFDGARVPVWRSSHELAWYRWNEADGVFYVQINGVANPPGTTLAAFAEDMFRAADAHPVRSFVLDVRDNGGGNNTLLKPLIVGLVRRPALSSRGRFFIITGPATFSAAQNLINRLETYAEPTFVGEPSGENGNFYGDTVPLTLPNSKLTIALAKLYWQDLDPRDRRTATFPTLSAPMTLRDYAAGRDPAYEAILAHRDDAPLEPTLRAAARARGYDGALAAYDAFVRDPVHRYADPEPRLNALGYALLAETDKPAALAVFRVNAERHPESWNAWDSLGEAYAAAGDVPRAVAAYERSLRLNPASAGGRDALAKLRGRPATSDTGRLPAH